MSSSCFCSARHSLLTLSMSESVHSLPQMNCVMPGLQDTGFTLAKSIKGSSNLTTNLLLPFSKESPSSFPIHFPKQQLPMDGNPSNHPNTIPTWDLPVSTRRHRSSITPTLPSSQGALGSWHIQRSKCWLSNGKNPRKKRDENRQIGPKIFRHLQRPKSPKS